MTRQTLQVRNVAAQDTLDFSGETVYGDFRDSLVRDGFAVVKGVIPKQRAAEYVERMQGYLEGFGLGYKRDDPSTIHEDHLPIISEKGMLGCYGVSHEQVVWDIRAEPGVIEAYSKVYDTDDLIVSFDQVNVTFPNRKDIKENVPWAHQDQDPDRPGFRCLQGIVNLGQSGPKDGGLVVMPRAHLISEEFHDTFRNETRIWQWTNEWYGYTEAGLAWLKERGYEFIKVCAEPGDLLIWDSRTPHYNASPVGSNTRFAVYTTYAPVSTATQDDLLKKKQAFEEYAGTSHWAQCLQTAKFKAMRNGKPDPADRDAPLAPPVLSERAFKLTGIPYITASA